MKYLCAILLGLLFTTSVMLHAEEGSLPHGTIQAMEGHGTPKVRRASGIEVLAAKGLELFAGDRVTTDADSILSVVFPDSSTIKIGINTEYVFQSISAEKSTTSWFFELVRGGIHAVIENFDLKNKSKYRISTPEGTIGIRGTELILQHDPSSHTSSFYLTEGEVELGAPDCFEKNNCAKLTAGNRVEFKNRSMQTPVKFTAKDILGVSRDKAESTAVQDERTVLLAGITKAPGVKARLETKDDSAADKDLEEMEKQLQNAQAELLDISPDALERLKAAKKEGKLKELLEAGNRFASMSGLDDDDSPLKRMALGAVISGKKNYNNGKFDKAFVNKNREADDVKKVRSTNRTNSSENQPKSDWRSVKASSGNNKYAPSAAIQNMQSQSIDTKQGSSGNINSNYHVENRGGVLVNVSNSDPASATLPTPSAMAPTGNGNGNANGNSNGSATTAVTPMVNTMSIPTVNSPVIPQPRGQSDSDRGRGR